MKKTRKQLFRTFSEFYQNSNYVQFPHEHRSGGSFPVCLTRAKQSAVEVADPALPELLFVIGLRANIPFKWNIGDGWSKEQRFRTQDMVFSPAYTSLHHDCGGDHEVLFCYFPAEKLASFLDQEMGLNLSVFAPLHGPVFQDETIRSAAMKIWTECAQKSQISDLMIDGLMQTIIAQALRLAKIQTPVRAERLSNEIMSLIIDYIENNYDESFGISELTRLANCSTFYFSRSFKKTTGKTPYQFILERRVLRARQLIADGELSLADIALRCGFYDQAHMTRVFRKHLGITPGRYLKELHR